MPDIKDEEVVDVVDEVIEDAVDSDTDDEVEEDSTGKRKSYKSEVDLLKKETEVMRKVIADRNKEAEKRRKQIKQWDELGVDLDTVKEMISVKEKAETAKMEEKGEWEKIKQKMVEDRDQMLNEKDEQMQSLQRSLENTLWDKGIENELLGNGADAPELVKDKVKAMTKLVEENGVFDIAVLDDAGEIRYTPNGDRMKLKDAITELKEHPVYGRAFPAPSISGMGTKPQGAGSSRGKPESTAPKKPRTQMDMNEKKAFIREHGISKYNALPLN